MISILTLAHRASSIHKKYAKIHAQIFSFSISQLLMSIWKKMEPAYCDYEADLKQLCEELAAIRSIIDKEDELEPLNTIGREFAFALDVYIIALTDAITWLSTICGRHCRKNKGEESYDHKQEWVDRAKYDDAIQQYRHLGRRLGNLFERL